MLIAIGAVLAGAAIGLAIGSRSPQAPGARASGADSAATMDAAAAGAAATRHIQAGDDLGSLPYLRRIVALNPGLRPAHTQLSRMLGNAALEPRHDAPMTATRSSIERVALLREALAELDRAEQLAMTPADRAAAIGSRAIVLRIWGFPWDAVRELERAAAIDPQWAELSESVKLMQIRLEHPERKVAGIDE